MTNEAEKTGGAGDEKKVGKKDKEKELERKTQALFQKLEEAGKGVESFGEKAEKAGSKASEGAKGIAEMIASIDNLIKKINEGAIPSLKEFEEAVGSAANVLNEARESVDIAYSRIKAVLGTVGEDSKEIEKLQKSQAEKIKDELAPELEKFYEKIEKLAKVVVTQGLAGPEGPGGMGGRQVDLLREVSIPKLMEKDKSEREKVWDKTRAAISALEVQDKSFGESWRDTWPIETLLATLYTQAEEMKETDPEGSERLKTFQRDLRVEYEDRRRVHDYFWFYQRCSGVESILNMSAILPKSAIERMVKKEGVGVAMYKMQEMLEKWDEQKKIRDRAREKEEKARKEAAQAEMNKISEEIKRFGRGFKLVKRDEKDVEVEDEDAEVSRIAARMMVILGFCAQYNYTEFGGAGDFFIGRILNLRDYMKLTRKGQRWQHRDKIIAGFRQHLYFAPPLSSQHWDFDDEKKKKVGIEIVPEDIEGTDDKRIIVKIIKPTPDKHNPLEEFEVLEERREYWLGGAQFADCAFKADKGRALIRNTGQFLDRPTPEMFEELAKDFEHLSGRGRWEFFANLTEGFIDFNKGEGGAISRLLKGQPPATRHEITDPVTGEKKSFISFASSDAERMGIGTGWNSAQIDFFINKILNSTDLLDPAYAEWLKRKKLGFLGLPGVGPVRSIKEVYEIVRKNIFWALLAMILETLKASLPEELGIEEKKKKR